MRAEELETFSPEHVDRLYSYINRTKEKLQEIMAQGVAEGVFPPYDPYYLACMLMGLVEGMEIQWLEDSKSFDLRRAMGMAMDLLSALTAGKELNAAAEPSRKEPAGKKIAGSRSGDVAREQREIAARQSTRMKGKRS
jgi:hypothetical protein